MSEIWKLLNNEKYYLRWYSVFVNICFFYYDIYQAFSPLDVVILVLFILLSKELCNKKDAVFIS